LAAWLIPQTTGPARIIPVKTATGAELNGTPDAITPHRYAHIGGNHVIGLIRVSMARGCG